MREAGGNGGRTVLQIQVGLLDLNKQYSLAHIFEPDIPPLHRKQGLELLRENNMHHLHLTYLADRYHPCSSEEVKEH